MTTSLREGASVTVTIDGVDDEGRGRASFSAGERDLDVAVRGALPGDVVMCTIDRVWGERGLAQARAVSFTSHSALHVARTCPHTGPCPGCPLEGVEPGFALALKRERVVRALLVLGLAHAAAAVDDVVPAQAPRQKVKLTAGGSAGGLRLGLFVPHSHTLVGAEECPHAHPAIADALAVLGDALDATGLPPASRDPRGLKAVIARAFRAPSFLAGAGAADVVVGAVVVTGAALSQEDWRALVACVDGAPLLSLALRVDGAHGNSLVGGDIVCSQGPQMLPPLEGGPDASVDAFCQPDPALAVALYTRVARFLLEAAAPDASFVDAYAGAGGFSRALLSLAPQARVIAIERAPEGVRTLRAFPRHAVDVLASSVEDALPALATRAFAGAVLDPPKSGLKDAARPLAALGIPRVALVACDPDAGARDAKVFIDAGYRTIAVEPYDLFPATPEVETLILLAR